MEVNGKYMKVVSPITIELLIFKEGYNQDRVAVELNGKIVPRSEYGTTLLGDEDSVEIVRFVGGG